MAGGGACAATVHVVVERGEKWRGGGGLLSCPQVWKVVACPDRWIRQRLHEGWARMEALWSAALPLLRQHMGERNFAAWIEPIRCQSCDGEIQLEVPSRFFQSWVTRHFLLDDPRHAERAVGRAVRGARRRLPRTRAPSPTRPRRRRRREPARHRERQVERPMRARRRSVGWSRTTPSTRSSSVRPTRSRSRRRRR